VRWNGQDSREYIVGQGVKQGSLISPHLYKLYINDLKDLETSGLGLHIGSIYVGSPTCADDVTLITDETIQVQPLLDTAQEYADRHGYQLHPSKSTVTELVRRKKDTSADATEGPEWMLKGKTVTVTDNFTHLGMNWASSKARPDVEMNIKRARRAAYALLKVGLYGGNGLDPPAAIKILHTYVIPVLLHGLEATVLNRNDVATIDNF
jgi:hypothetical protein